MASRKDDNRENPSAQKALQDYLDLMLGVGTERPEETVSPSDSENPVQPVASASVAPASSLHLTMAAVENRKKIESKPTTVVETGEALQQKLVQARVKDLAEKSLQSVSTQSHRVSADSERRERMAAARELVKLRIAERMASAKVEPAPNPAEPEPAPVLQEPMQSMTLQVAVEQPSTIEKIALPPAPEWLENGRPVWAQSGFECLLFSVSGLVLAVPLIELGTIYPLREHLTPIIGQIDWFLGLMHVDGRKNVRTVNTAKIVMPEKYDPAFADRIRYVISINGHDWGLAVDKIDKAITLNPDDVRWRVERSKRPWLAGTVVDYMCALIDVQELALMLSRSDHGTPQLRH